MDRGVEPGGAKWGAPHRELFGYGSKLTFEGLGQLGTTQLDLVILPAVLVATDIGFYAVATSTATVIYLIFGRLGQIVLPVAARHDAASAVAFIARAMRSTEAL